MPLPCWRTWSRLKPGDLIWDPRSEADVAVVLPSGRLQWRDGYLGTLYWPRRGRTPHGRCVLLARGVPASVASAARVGGETLEAAYDLLEAEVGLVIGALALTSERARRIRHQGAEAASGIVQRIAGDSVLLRSGPYRCTYYEASELRRGARPRPGGNVSGWPVNGGPWLLEVGK
jgi:hypothetical protein